MGVPEKGISRRTRLTKNIRCFPRFRYEAGIFLYRILRFRDRPAVLGRPVFLPDDLCRYSGNDCLFFNILRNNGTGTDGGISADLHIFHQTGHRADICLITDHCRRIVIGTDIQKLGKIDVVANDRVAVDHNAHTVSQIATVTDPGLEGDLDLVDRLAEPVHRDRPPEQKSFVLGEADFQTGEREP